MIIYATLDHLGPLTCGFTVSAQKKILGCKTGK